MFYSVVDQLKQAQFVSDFGSVTAQVLDPPAATENRPSVPLVLIAGPGAGLRPGGGGGVRRRPARCANPLATGDPATAGLPHARESSRSCPSGNKVT